MQILFVTYRGDILERNWYLKTFATWNSQSPPADISHITHPYDILNLRFLQQKLQVGGGLALFTLQYLLVCL
jgi:hypothetical protein